MKSTRKHQLFLMVYDVDTKMEKNHLVLRNKYSYNVWHFLLSTEEIELSSTK